MNETKIDDALLNDLASLADDVPPMPDDLHAGWMKLVEETPMTEKKPVNHALRRTLTRVLSAAAALVFVIGGTLLSRDSLMPATRADKSAAPRTESSENYDSGYGVSRAYSGSAAPSLYAAVEEPAEYEVADMDEAATVNGAAADMAVRESKIIRTASLTLTTQDFDSTLQSVRDLCASMGGWASYINESTGCNGLRSGWLTLRVPSDRLDAFLEGTGSAGRVTSRNETASDVTESYYDTAARLQTQQVLLARLQALATDAADLTDLLELEQKIADVQYTIDRLQASLNSTDHQVNYATVDITIREEKPADTVQDTTLSLGVRLIGALSHGWEAFTDFLADAAVFLAASLPFLVILFLVILLIRAAIRSLKRRGRHV